jgi:hypothetical protein
MVFERVTELGVQGEEAPSVKVGSAVFGGAAVAKGNAAVSGVWAGSGDDARPAGAGGTVKSIGSEGGWGIEGKDQCALEPWCG